MSKREVVQRVFRLLGGLFSETAALYREATKSASEIADQQAAEAVRQEAARREAARQAAEAVRQEAARQEAARQAAEVARQESTKAPISVLANPHDVWGNVVLKKRFIADLRDHLQEWEMYQLLAAVSAEELVSRSIQILEQLLKEETENASLAHAALTASLQRLGIEFIHSTQSSAFPQTSIESFVRARNISCLVHFTRVDSLGHILREGILNQTRLRGLQRPVVDQYRFDGKPDHVCTSVQFPNYQMFYRYSQDDAADWCVLSISPSILWRQDCLFYPYNAASSELARRPASDFRGLGPFEDLFAKAVQNRERHPLLPDSFPTSPQAEVLVPSVISASDILSVHFYSSSAIDSCQQLLLSSQLRCFVSREFFKPRLDWEKWRRP